MKKRLSISIILLLIFRICIGANYKNEQIFSSVQSLQTLTVNCDGYESLKQASDSVLATSDSDRGFVLRNSFGLVKLSAAQNPANPSSGTATVELEVTYEVERNGRIIQNSENVSLSLTIDAVEFRDIDYFKFEEALSLSVKILDVQNASLFPDLKLSISCEGEIFRFLPPSARITGARYTAPAVRSGGGLVDGNLYVSWDDLQDISGSVITAGVEYYELEWTYISSQGAQPGTTRDKNSVVLRDGIFRNNSSRVTTTTKGYFIPLVYEKGWIVFRVRPAGKNLVDGQLTDVKGRWTISDNTTSLTSVEAAYIYTFEGLENNLNWQSSISFAEEGKNKTVVSYHDGSLRNRQAVTKINTDERAIAGETYYDYNGRPVIQTLPVPVEGEDENNLNFRPGFNAAEGKSGLYKSDYDQATSGQGCVPLAPQLDISKGASKYYSPNNNFGNQGNTGQDILNKEYIPDAKQYPYTQTQYTNDNTGRIAAQSGVGDAHILGSGHETKYLYGVPLQGEISRLFGTQVGLSAHYKKNTVIDPNGQVSVSYLDMDGKVIATALAGGNSTGLDNLPGNSSRTISSNLISTATNVTDSDGKGKTLIHTFTVSTEVPYTFTYDMTAGIHSVTCKGLNSDTAVTLELSGVFDATLSLYNSCSTAVFSQSVSTNASFGTSATDQERNITRVVPADQMKIGQYYLVKTIRINSQKLKNYLDQYLSNDQYTCVLTDDHFIAEATEEIDFAGCDISCDDCKARINGLITELNLHGVTLSADETANLFERCDAICMENVTCLSALYNMLASVSPDGQYGQVRRMPAGLENTTNLDMNNISENFDNTNRDFPVGQNGGEPSLSSSNALVPEEFPLSIFNSNNQLLPNSLLRTNGNNFYRADWRKPLEVTVAGYTKSNFKNQVIFEEDLSAATYSVTDYKDENGELIYVLVQETSPGVYSPAIVAGAPVESANDPFNPGLKKVLLRYLADDKEFIKRFEPHFANYLVPYHPEFQYYVECTSMNDLNAYGEEMIDENTVTGAVNFLEKESASDYYYPAVLAKDPIFTSPKIPADLRNKLAEKVTQYDFQYDETGQRVIVNNSPQYYSMAQYATIMINCPDPNSTCKKINCDNGKFLEEDIEEWIAFKSLYLTERQKIIREAATRKAVQGRYYNGCIGNKSFKGSAEEANLFTPYEPANRLSLQEMRDLGNALCASTGAIPLNYSFYWGHRFLNYCGYPVVYPFRNSILYRLNLIPAYDPAQTCSRDRAVLYKDKIRAFFPPLPGSGQVGSGSGKCYEIVTDNSGNGTFIPTDCNLSLLDQGDIMENAAAIRNYKNCGLCPVVEQVRDFVTDLIENEVLNDSALAFNCITNALTLSFGKELETYLNNSLQSTVLYNWVGSFNQSGKILTGTISTTPSGTKEMKILLDFSGSGISESAWSNKQDEIFKNIKIAGITLDGANNNKFILKAYLNLNRGLPNHFSTVAGILNGANSDNFTTDYENLSIYRYEFNILGTINTEDANGTTPVVLNDCSFPPLCTTSQYPEYVLTLLNTLSYVDDTDIDENPETITPLKPYDLYIPGGANLPVVDADVYDDPVRSLLGFTAKDSSGDYVESLNSKDITWSSSIAGDAFTGVLSYQNNAPRSLEIKIKPFEYPNAINNPDFSSIKYFTNIRPFSIDCTSEGFCSSNKFIADAVMEQEYDGNPNSLLYYKVVIKVTTKTNGQTDNVMPTLSVCEKVETGF